MKFFVENVPVYFPYPFVYEEQYAYMRHLKRAIDRKGNNHVCILGNLLHPLLGSHCMLEMPTGTRHIPDYTTCVQIL
jgi:DNA excision repair protein ERCC-2